MIRFLWSWFAGYRTITVSAEDSAQAINCLQKCTYNHWNLQTDAQGTVSFCLQSREAGFFLNLCKEKQIQAAGGALCGFPQIRRKYKNRWGIPAGALVFALIVWLSTTVVWSLEISGNESFSDSEIQDMLSLSGFGEGTKFGEMDFELFQNDFALQHPSIAWIAINMLGNRAFVEVRESSGNPKSEERAAANVIAAEDGQIVEVRVFDGRAEVIPCQTVRKGELLISGIMSIREGELHFDHACGQVLAQVNRTVQAEIPLCQLKKEYSGKQKREIQIIFFGKKIKVFQKGGFDGATYDTIIENIPITLPGDIHLPIKIRSENSREYADVSVQLTEAEALALAERQFGEELTSLLANAEILSLEKEITLQENSCRITGRALCIADIAQTQNIPFNEP